MNQKKIGFFLKELRKEQGLTQEMLAERLGVSNRSVSRWETGNNLPDISLLAEIAEFYQVDIREIIDGERKSEKMNEEVKDTIGKVADYAAEEQVYSLKWMKWLSISGLGSILIYSLMTALEPEEAVPVYEYINGLFLGLTIGSLVALVLQVTGKLEGLRAHGKGKKKPLVSKLIIALCIAVALAGLIASILASQG